VFSGNSVDMEGSGGISGGIFGVFPRVRVWVGGGSGLSAMNNVMKAVKPIGMKWVGRGRWQAIP
jgi:hypothetical protein